MKPSAVLAGTGALSAIVAASIEPTRAGAAAAQDWPPFVLVAGLLLIGLVAEEDGLFSAAGHQLARLARGGAGLFAGCVLLVAVVTAVLNLDTSVAFLTPVLIYTARSRGEGEAPLLYGCLLLSNAGSLLLPGSNLTNLIVLGELHLSGSVFLARMALPWVTAVALTAAVVAVADRHQLRATARDLSRLEPPRLGLGLLATAAALALVVTLRSPALPVLVVGLVAVVLHAVLRRGDGIDRAVQVLGLPLLIGLFGVAVALGTAGRSWSAPTLLLGHLDPWATAAVAAVVAVAVNNLPAASLLAAKAPHHPFSLLVGLNLGPNLFVTGSLSWLLWLRAARAVGSSPSIGRASRLGLIAAPLSMAAAVGVLELTALH